MSARKAVKQKLSESPDRLRAQAAAFRAMAALEPSVLLCLAEVIEFDASRIEASAAGAFASASAPTVTRIMAATNLPTASARKGRV